MLLNAVCAALALPFDSNNEILDLTPDAEMDVLCAASGEVFCGDLPTAEMLFEGVFAEGPRALGPLEGEIDCTGSGCSGIEPPKRGAPERCGMGVSMNASEVLGAFFADEGPALMLAAGGRTYSQDMVRSGGVQVTGSAFDVAGTWLP